MKIILVTGSLGEGAGGLASAVRSWADALAENGQQITLFCLDQAEIFGRNLLPSHPAVEVEEVRGVIEPTTRLIVAPKLRAALKRYVLTRRCDVIHTNGIWQPGTRISSGISRAYKIPLVVSPHGSLQPWAIAHGSVKKKVGWHLSGKKTLANSSLVQAASDAEAEGIRALGVKTPIAHIPNIVSLPTAWPSPIQDGDSRKTVLFLSRIHPSKGLLDLVEAWAALRPKGWRVVVAGYDEVGHVEAVRRAISHRGLDHEFVFVGPVPYEQRWSWYRAADLFALPTYSENFGVTVAEALGAGVPAITTTAAPWRILLENRCGWWVDPGPRGLQTALSSAMELDDVARSEMGARGRRLVLGRFSSTAVAKRLIESYRWVCQSGAIPSWVQN